MFHESSSLSVSSDHVVSSMYSQQRDYVGCQVVAHQRFKTMENYKTVRSGQSCLREVEVVLITRL